eukprot:8838458-Alexandrium_andersonii.AAC.1
MIDTMKVCEPTPCRWCGAEQATHEHLFWQCAKFQGVREAAWEGEAIPPVGCLPPVLKRCGLPPALVLDFSGDHAPFWGK